MSSAAPDQRQRWAASQPCAERCGSSRPVQLHGAGKKGTATAGAAEGERVGTLGVVGVHPAQHSVRRPTRAPGHLAGAAVLGDVEEGERPLAGAGVGCAHSQMAQVLRRLTPARIVNS